MLARVNYLLLASVTYLLLASVTYFLLASVTYLLRRYKAMQATPRRQIPSEMLRMESICLWYVSALSVEETHTRVIQSSL